MEREEGRVAESSRRAESSGNADHGQPGERQRSEQHFLEDYLRYRFGSGETSDNLAGQCGVTPQVLNDALAGKKISENDLNQIARAINVSRGLAEELFGERPMPDLMHQTLDRFFAAQREAAPDTSKHGHKGTRAA